MFWHKNVNAIVMAPFSIKLIHTLQPVGGAKVPPRFVFQPNFYYRLMN